MTLQTILRAVRKSPIFAVFLAWLLQEFSRFVRSKRELRLCRGLLLSGDTDVSLVQACLLSTETLLNLGRVEKRTLFVQPLKRVVYNPYLVERLVEAARKTIDGYVLRHLDEQEKYHILQACVNQVSSLFASNYVAHNALGTAQAGNEPSNSTWYCLTLLVENPEGNDGQHEPQPAATMCNMRFRPQPSLKVVLVNETDLRKIHDGKLSQPSWGLFNDRHKRRWILLKEIAQHYNRQLLDGDSNEQCGVPSMWAPVAQVDSFSSPEKCKRPPRRSATLSAGQFRNHSEGLNDDGGMLRRIRSDGSCTDLLSPPLMSRSGANAVKESSAGLKNSFLRIHIPFATITKKLL